MQRIKFSITLFSLLFLSCQFLQAQNEFQLPALPYALNALEPSIDSMTMDIHYNRHHRAYVTNLNKAVSGTDAKGMKIEVLLSKVSTYSEAVRNNAGGHYNHSLFWTILTPEKNTKPSAALQKAIVAQFGSIDSLKTLINDAAAKRFGSGWAWLSVDANGKLFVSSTPNQDNPLMDIAEKKGTPILGIDVWEHAYYLKYQNKRGDYLAAIWSVINWNEVSNRYQVAISKK
jgi:Fe-Mn family superoxide dismutase